MKKGWVLTQELFDPLLDWLDPDRERAGHKYETIRLKLIKIFTSRGDGGASVFYYWSAIAFTIHQSTLHCRSGDQRWPYHNYWNLVVLVLTFCWSPTGSLRLQTLGWNP
jgi:hypothetical protein